MGISLLSYLLFVSYCEVSHAAHIPRDDVFTQHNHDVINPRAEIVAQENHGVTNQGTRETYNVIREETDDVMTLMDTLMEQKSQQTVEKNRSGKYTFLNKPST